MASRSVLLKHALKHVETHGFSRRALALAPLSLSSSHGPLPETAISALFGSGVNARKTLINAWLDQGRLEMRNTISGVSTSGREGEKVEPVTVRDALRARLEWNKPVLQYLPEAFILLATPGASLPPIDPRPALLHAATVADEACYLADQGTSGTAWYSQRAILASIYTAAELHQLAAPELAFQFLDKLLDASSTLDEVDLFSRNIVRSWTGIVKSAGLL